MLSNPALSHALRACTLFKGLTEAALTRLADIGTEKAWNEGAVIFNKGDPSNTLLLVLTGRVSIREITDDGRTLTLAFFGPGEVFGEIGVIDGRSRSADAVADTNARLLVVDRRRFLSYLEENPVLAIRLMQTICQRLRETNELVEGMAFKTVRTRIARRLLALAEARRAEIPATAIVEIRLTGQELANYCALTRESVSKQLARWRESGYLTINRGRIGVLNFTALEDAAKDPE